MVETSTHVAQGFSTVRATPWEARGPCTSFGDDALGVRLQSYFGNLGAAALLRAGRQPLALTGRRPSPHLDHENPTPSFIPRPRRAPRRDR